MQINILRRHYFTSLLVRILIIVFACSLGLRQATLAENSGSTNQSRTRLSRTEQTVKPEFRATITQVDPDLKEGVDLLKSGKLDEAKSIFRSAVEKNPDNSEAYFHLGFIEQTKGKYVFALANYKIAETLDPAQGAYSLAVRSMERVLHAQWATYPLDKTYYPSAHDERNLLNQGSRFFAIGALDEALYVFDKSKQMNPKNPNTFFNLGVVYEAKGDMHEALDNYQHTYSMIYGNYDLAIRSALDTDGQNLTSELQTAISDVQEKSSAKTIASKFVIGGKPVRYLINGVGEITHCPTCFHVGDSCHLPRLRYVEPD